VLFICAVVIVGTYTFLPSFMEGLAARSLQDGLGLSEAPEVSLVSDPAPDVLFGKFEEGEVVLPSLELGDVNPDEVTVELDPFDLDMLGSLLSGGIESEDPLSGRFRMELSEEEIARLATSSGASGTSAVAPVKNVRLEEGYAVVGSEFEVFGARILFGVQGEIFLRDGDLVFQPRRLEALGEPVPDRLARDLLSEVGFAYPIDELPFEGEISGVEVHEGRLVLTGEVRDLPVG
jgi:hypothetical protein